MNPVTLGLEATLRAVGLAHGINISGAIPDSVGVSCDLGNSHHAFVFVLQDVAVDDNLSDVGVGLEADHSLCAVVGHQDIVPITRLQCTDT